MVLPALVPMAREWVMGTFLSLVCAAVMLYGFSRFSSRDWQGYARGQEIAAATPKMVSLVSVSLIGFSFVFIGLNFLALTDLIDAGGELFLYMFGALALAAAAILAVVVLAHKYVGYLVDHNLIKDFRYTLLLPLWALIMIGFFGSELLKANWAWSREYRSAQMSAYRLIPAEKVTPADLRPASESEILPEILPENETGLLGN